MTDKEIIREAYYALAGFRSPSLSKEKREQELARCWHLLAEAVHGEHEESDSDVEDDWSCTPYGEQK